MADNDDSTISKKPNSLDRIGTMRSEPISTPSESLLKKQRGDIETAETAKMRTPSELLLKKQRGDIETAEMRKIRQQLDDERRKNEEIMRQVGRVRGGAEQPTESLFRSLGLSAPQARSAMSIPAENLISAVVRQSAQYEKQFSIRTQELESQLEQKRQERQAVATRMFEQSVISRVAHPRMGARSAGYTDDYLSAAAETYAASGTRQTLAKGIERISRSREATGMVLVEASKNVQTPEGQAEYLKVKREFEEKVRKERALEEAYKLSTKQESELKKTSERGEKTVESIMKRRGELEIRTGVEKGEFGSVKDIQRNLKSAEDAFIDAIKNFNNEVATTKKVSEETAEALNKANKELEKQQTIAAEAGADGRGGGGRRDIFNKIATYGDMLGRATDLGGYLAVGLQSEKMGMRIGMASAMNQRNADIFAATQGDMSALRRLTENQFEKAVNFSGAYRTRAEAAGGIGALIDIGTGAAGAAAAASGIFPWSLSGGSVASNLISGARTGAQVLSGVTGAGTELQFFQSFNQLKDIINDIPDASKQAFFDYRQNALLSMRGAGQRTSAMYDEAVAASTMTQMAALGITPTETNRLFGVGINAIGASFVRDPSAARQMVARGAELQAGGYMSAEDYLQRVGQATALGGGQKDIEEVLARAVTRGVDDARSLNNLFNIIGSIARSGTSPGTPSMGTAANAMSNMMDMLKDLPIDETLKQTLAASEIEKANQRTSFSNVDIPSMVYLQGVEERFPGISPVEKGKLSNVSLLEQISKLKLVSDLKPGEDVPLGTIAALGGTKGAFLQGFKFRGTDSFFNDLVKKALASNVPEISDISGKDAATLEKYLRTGDEALLYKELSKEGQKRIDVGRVISDRALISAAYQKQLPIQPLPGLTGEAAATQATFGIKAGALTKQILAGQSFYEQLGEQARLAGGGGPLQPPYAAAQAPMSYVASMMGMQLEQYSPEKAGKEAAQAAEKMTLDSSEFDKSVTNFSAAVDKLVRAVEPLEKNLMGAADLGFNPFTEFGGPVKDQSKYNTWRTHKGQMGIYR